MPDSSAPLAGIRVVDAVAGPLAPITRYLADLGADVVRIVPNDADPVTALAANRGKQPGDASHLSTAHLIVDDTGLDLASLRAANPALVTMTVSAFGTGNGLSDWASTGPVLHALSGELSRSGIRDRAPLLPPGDLAHQCAAVQAAHALLVSLFHALRTGTGDHLDFDALGGAIQALDPGFGIGGSATLGRPAHLLSRDLPPRGYQYPIIACADGHVRICVLAARQWQGLFRWMGEPAAFADPSFAKVGNRYKSPDLLPAIAAFFAPQTRADLEREAEAHGVPLAAIATLAEVTDSPHFRARNLFADVPLPDGRTVPLPGGPITIGSARNFAPDPTAVFPVPTEPRHPHAFTGLKVLDLGIIVVGAEAGRLLADQGADVVKLESRAFPDGNRQSHLSYGLSAGFAAGHRNKRSLGLDLRSPAGKAIFLRLVAQADVILSNFKPGTLTALGLDPDTLTAANPGIISVESSAFGNTGPWSRRMGYGPLVRAATGLSDLWRYPGDPEGFADSITIYPDHVAGRMSAIAATALLIRRLRTGRGGHAAIAQADVMLAQFAEPIARASLGDAPETDAPWGVYPTAGDDEWCVVTVRGDSDWTALATATDIADPVLTRPQRIAARETIEHALCDWLAQHTSTEAMDILQQAGVPAARMLRVSDLRDFGWYRQRGLLRDETHPYLGEPVTGEAFHVVCSALAEPPRTPAPLMGEQSAEVLHDWLGIDAEHFAALVAAGTAEPTEPAIHQMIAAAMATAAE